MSELRRFLETLTGAPTAEVLWRLHCEKMAEYGFDRIIYGFSHYMSETSMGDPADFVLLTNHDPAYMQLFMGNNLYRDAPMVRWALHNVGACSWRYLWDEMARGTLTEREKHIIEINQMHGVTAGYSISFKAITSRSKGAIALTARKGMSQDEVDAIWAEHGSDIVVMNNVAHLKIVTLPQQTEGRSLTKRQREALEWVGDGKTTQDIALLMGLTAATVEKHLRLAREALSVETTAQAVLKASFQNQMFIVDGL
ncbi:LuxR family transcriptional regulator [Planktotalea arctica]|uniref:LuxR family transcriptional regulator n=1 Tax=Planktotalea arctica TaxID=1481893 RepID=UPI000A173D4C|nr:LuxR family transcriptional regulator [Planktotalea arctica]